MNSDIRPLPLSENRAFDSGEVSIGTDWACVGMIRAAGCVGNMTIELASSGDSHIEVRIMENRFCGAPMSNVDSRVMESSRCEVHRQIYYDVADIAIFARAKRPSSLRMSGRVPGFVGRHD